jgi:plasmid stabilization system protein ParE
MAGSLISPEALQDLQSIQEFIALDNPHAAEKIIDQLFAAFENLAKFPHIGHRRPDLTNRNVQFWATCAYLVVYRIVPDGLQIVAILHGAQDVPRVLENR